MQVSRAIIQYAFEQCSLAFAPALHASSYDFAANDRSFTELQLCDRQKIPPVFVSTWAVEQ